MKITWKLLSSLLAVMLMTACSNGAPTYSELPAAGSSATKQAGAKAAAPASSLPAVAQGSSGSDLIAPQDLLNIEVFKVPDLSKTVRVEDNGKITLPLIGSIQASGMSASRLEKVIAQRLEKDYMHNPQVNVFVEESTRNRVTVSGAVNRPGVFPLAGDTTVTQAIAEAEGLSRLAVKDNVTLFRNGKPYTVRLEDINKGKAQDPIVMAGDKIHVHTSGVKEGLADYGRLIAPFSLGM